MNIGSFATVRPGEEDAFYERAAKLAQIRLQELRDEMRFVPVAMEERA